MIAYFAEEGFTLGDYFSEWWDTIPNAQLTADLVLVCPALLVWAGWAAALGVRRWRWAIVATFTVGICMGVPLYLWMRERALATA